jgi:hypothetical protein
MTLVDELRAENSNHGKGGYGQNIPTALMQVKTGKIGERLEEYRVSSEENAVREGPSPCGS